MLLQTCFKVLLRVTTGIDAFAFQITLIHGEKGCNIVRLSFTDTFSNLGYKFLKRNFMKRVAFFSLGILFQNIQRVTVLTILCFWGSEIVTNSSKDVQHGLIPLCFRSPSDIFRRLEGTNVGKILWFLVCSLFAKQTLWLIYNVCCRSRKSTALVSFTTITLDIGNLGLERVDCRTNVTCTCVRRVTRQMPYNLSTICKPTQDSISSLLCWRNELFNGRFLWRSKRLITFTSLANNTLAGIKFSLFWFWRKGQREASLGVLFFFTVHGN